MSNEDSMALFASKIKATPKAVGRNIKNVNISKTNRNQVESNHTNENNLGQLEKFEKNLELNKQS